MEQAAQVPLTAYATVYHALAVRNQLRQGDKCLIQTGCGPLGQAAISVALNMGACVFIKCKNIQERELFKAMLPSTLITDDMFVIGEIQPCQTFNYVIYQQERPQLFQSNTFVPSRFVDLCEVRPEEILKNVCQWEKVKQLVQEGLRQGVVRQWRLSPVFKMSQMEKALKIIRDDIYQQKQVILTIGDVCEQDDEELRFPK
jgi:hypothetical protein